MFRRSGRRRFARGGLLRSESDYDCRETFEEKRLRLSEERSQQSFRQRNLRHWSATPLSKMKEDHWRLFRENMRIVVKGRHVPRPIRAWFEADFPKEITKIIDTYPTETPKKKILFPSGTNSDEIVQGLRSNTPYSQAEISCSYYLLVFL